MCPNDFVILQRWNNVTFILRSDASNTAGKSRTLLAVKHQLLKWHALANEMLIFDQRCDFVSNSMEN